MTAPSFISKKEANAAGWFSRRHRTSEACYAAKSSLRGEKERRRKEAEARQAEFEKLSTKQKFDKAFKLNPNSKETWKWKKRLQEEKEVTAAPEAVTKNTKQKNKNKKRIGKQRERITSQSEQSE